VHDLRTMQIPATVQALLAARIDRLPFEEKQLLQSAAVIGTDVPLVLLQEIADLSEDDLRRGLAHLQEGEFLYETRLFPDPEYTFKHALTHDVAYSGLLRERRRLLHRRVGQAIEARYADRLAECAEMLANQFERGEDWAKAVHYHLRAAKKVKEQHAYQNAVQLCTRALALAANVQVVDEERVRGLVLLGDLWSLMGDVEQANQYYEQALQGMTDITMRQRIANKRHQPHIVIRNGARIAFYEHGSGSDTLVLAHPVARGRACFQPLVEKLCQEFRIITIDPRGTGVSDPLTPPYTLKEHAEDVRAVIEASWAGPIVGVGGSRGATLMVALAAAYPALVQKLILISGHASPRVTLAQLDWLDTVKELLRQGQKEQALRIAASVSYSEPGTGYLTEQRVQYGLSLPTDIILNFYTPDPEDDVVSVLPHIRVPTLVMHGTADRYVPFAMGRYLAEHISGAQFYALEGRGHAAISTATSEIYEVLRCFVRTGRVPES
jgi:pimeloyl-ACP methyl ester carboxylesterase